MSTRDPGCPLPTPQSTPLTPGSTPAFLESSAPHLRERLLTFPQHFEISAVGRISGSLSTTFLKPGTHSRVPGMTQLSSPSAAFSLKMHPKVGLTRLNANRGCCRSTSACAVGKPCRAAGGGGGPGPHRGLRRGASVSQGQAEHRPRHCH